MHSATTARIARLLTMSSPCRAGALHGNFGIEWLGSCVRRLATLAAMIRRKTMPPELAPAWDAFVAVADRVQTARRVVLSCLPVGRVEPAPVPVGLDVLADELTAVRADMAAWRRAEVEQSWQACQESIDEALAAIPPAKHVAQTSTELEELLGAVSDVVEPLGDAFQAAERHWRSLRRR